MNMSSASECMGLTVFEKFVNQWSHVAGIFEDALQDAAACMRTLEV